LFTPVSLADPDVDLHDADLHHADLHDAGDRFG
jgi:hypothetical protein